MSKVHDALPLPGHGGQTVVGQIGGARFCADHNAWECVCMKSRNRGLCHGAAIKGTDRCKIHSGVSIAVARAQGEARITAWSALGTPKIDYRMAVLGVLQMTWLRLHRYGELLRQQVESEGAVPIEPGDGEGFDPEAEVKAGGLIGYRYGAGGKDGIVYAQSEEVRALVQLEAAERDKVVKYAKTAHDMGISDRLTSLAERWGDIVASKVTLVLGDLELTPEQMARVPGLLNRHLGSVDLEMIGGSVEERVS